MDKDTKKLVETLTTGRNSAKRLQSLLRRNLDKDGSVSVDNLVMEVMGSFASALSVLSSFHRVPVHPRVDLAFSVDRKPEIISGETERNLTPEYVTQRRGCYKRRRTIESRVKTSDTIEDGYVWRKYGQKEIINSKFPRCYFRCTHKLDFGCKALRQVQKLEDEPNMFHITYFGHHTCSPSYASSQTGVAIHDRKDSKIYSNLPNNPSTTTNVHNNPSLGQDLSASKDTQSLSAWLWEEIMIKNDLESFKSHGKLSDIPFADVFLL